MRSDTSANQSNELCFVGDLVSPAWAPLRFERFRKWLGVRRLVANLEGAILADFKTATPRWTQKYSLASVRRLLTSLPDSALLSVANNHVEDFLPQLRLPLAPEKIIGAAGMKPRLLSAGNRRIALFAFAFPATDPARWRHHQLPLFLRPRAALRRLARIRAEYPSNHLVAYVHWGYEFSPIPYPADRAWARRALEAGVDLIVGHHPHVLQPVEKFGAGSVAYSLGNFYLPDGNFFGKDLVFPGSSACGMALCYDGNTLTSHATVADFMNGDVTVLNGPGSDAKLPKAAFAGLTDRQYERFFREALETGGARIPAGLPVIRDYAQAGAMSEMTLMLWQDSRQIARDVLIRARLHNPYKEMAREYGRNTGRSEESTRAGLYET